MGKKPQKGLPGPRKHHPTGSSSPGVSPSIQALRHQAVPSRALGALENHCFHSWGNICMIADPQISEPTDQGRVLKSGHLGSHKQ